MPSKIVEIHRKPNFIQQSNTDPEVQDYFNMAFKGIGSYWKELGKVYATGLTRKEEDFLMPEILSGVNPIDNKFEFRKQVQNFYKDIHSKIPPEGLRLEIGLESEGELAENNPPLKLMDYLRYRHIIGHPQVGANKDAAERYQHIQFYIHDNIVETAGKTKLRDKEDAAQREYLNINKDMNKAEMVLTLLGVSTRDLTNDNLILALKAQATVNPDDSDIANAEKLEKFVAIVNDKHLAAKYDIMEMVKYGILERIRAKVQFKETGETLGNNLREAVDWLLDKSNSKAVNTLYAELDALAKGRRIKHLSPHLSDPTTVNAAK